MAVVAPILYNNNIYNIIQYMQYIHNTILYARPRERGLDEKTRESLQTSLGHNLKRNCQTAFSKSTLSGGRFENLPVLFARDFVRALEADMALFHPCCFVSFASFHHRALKQIMCVFRLLVRYTILD